MSCHSPDVCCFLAEILVDPPPVIAIPDPIRSRDQRDAVDRPGRRPVSQFLADHLQPRLACEFDKHIRRHAPRPLVISGFHQLQPGKEPSSAWEAVEQPKVFCELANVGVMDKEHPVGC